jgi:hypothetical protein
VLLQLGRPVEGDEMRMVFMNSKTDTIIYGKMLSVEEDENYRTYVEIKFTYITKLFDTLWPFYKGKYHKGLVKKAEEYCDWLTGQMGFTCPPAKIRLNVYTRYLASKENK